MLSCMSEFLKKIVKHKEYKQEMFYLMKVYIDFSPHDAGAENDREQFKKLKTSTLF